MFIRYNLPSQHTRKCISV